MIPFEQELELYHYCESLCSQKARIGFVEKQLDYKSHHIVICDVAEECQNLDDDYLKVNPKGIVPTLVHHGQPVYDAHQIIRHIDLEYPDSGTRLWPTDTRELKIADFWFDEGMLKDDQPLGTNFGTSIAFLSRPLLARMLQRQSLELVIEKYKRHPIEQRRKGFVALRKGVQAPREVEERALSILINALRVVNDQLAQSGGPWVLDEFSVVDITMMACFHRLEDIHLDDLLAHKTLPELSGYWERLQNRPSYQSAIVAWHDEENWRSAIKDLYGDKKSPILDDAVSLLI
ncbi:MAG: glutathione S-transferase family protein [Pseudomonadota bacterium]